MILAGIIFSAICSKGQVLEKSVENFIAKNKIDTSLIYSQGCTGHSFLIDSCKRDDAFYLLWLKNGRCFVNQFKNCQTSSVISIDNVNPLSFFLNNLKRIKEEKIRVPEFYEYQQTKDGIDTTFLSEVASHSCFCLFKMNIGDSIVSKIINSYNLNYSNSAQNGKNINYAYNQNTKLKSLIDQMSIFLKKIYKGLK